MDEARMTFLEHLGELRDRLVVAVIAVAISSSASAFFVSYLFKLLVMPAGKLHLIAISVAEAFMAKVKVSVFAGLFLASPIVFYQVSAYVYPALKDKEKRVVIPMIILFLIFFAIGIVFGWYFILPPSIGWLKGQAASIGVVNQFTVGQYVNFAGLFLLACGLAFETPIVVWLLVKLRIVSVQTLRKQWRYAYVIIFVFAAIATPDWSPVTMFLVAIPMIILYELSILLARVF